MSNNATEKIGPATERLPEISADEWESIEQRFWRNVEKTDGCWYWTPTKSRGTYGSFTVVKWFGSMGAHRAMLWITTRTFPSRQLLACHTCDVRCCVRPAHIFLGTYKDNIQDAVRKGRMASGDRHWKRRLKLGLRPIYLVTPDVAPDDSTPTKKETPMRLTKQDPKDPHVRLATRVPRSIHKTMRIHCVKTDESVMQFVERALRSQLEREAAR